MKQFNEEEKEDLQLEIDFNMKVLGDFPKKRIIESIELLPQELQDSYLLFENSFTEKNNGKSILGVSFNDSIEMEEEFESGKYTLLMNTS
jgi:hypothetical protein